MGPLKEPLIAADILSIYKDLNFYKCGINSITCTFHCRAISENMFLDIAFILRTTVRTSTCVAKQPWKSGSLVEVEHHRV